MDCFDRGQIFYNARKEYGKKSGKELSQETLASKLEELGIDGMNCSLATIRRIESGERAPQPRLAYELSKLYNMPELREIYCSEYCPIGMEDHPYSPPIRLKEAGYSMHRAGTSILKLQNLLTEIFEDGVIDEEEAKMLREMMPEIRKTHELLEDIELDIKKELGNLGL